MNEIAIRLEEQIISLFPGVDTLIYYGWILKKMERRFCVYPLYYKFSEGNIPDNIQRCEEISCQSGVGCVFRIVEHTNYHLSSILTDTGYALWKCGIVGELCLPDSESGVCRAEKGLFLRKGADEGNVEYVMAEGGMGIGIKRRELLFLPNGNLAEGVALEDILQFSKINGIKRILADIPETEELPEQYKQAGFNRMYLYRCYQKQKEGGLEDGFAE